jgi:hypothetical protein
MARVTSAGPPSPAATAIKVADEFGELLRPVATFLRRRSAEVVAFFAVLVTALAIFAVAGGVVDDRAIDKNKAVAEATVLDGSSFSRTLVQFTAANGDTIVPPDGISYPRGLQVGQSVPVEYDVTHPESVRVAGRGAVGQSGPLVLLVLGTWIVLGPIAYWLRRRRARV